MQYLNEITIHILAISLAALSVFIFLTVRELLLHIRIVRYFRTDDDFGVDIK